MHLRVISAGVKVVRYVFSAEGCHDNASVHHAEAVRQRANDWMQQGVFLHFLPSYSPELNLIETLWRKSKYEWLPLSAYKNYRAIKEAVLAILNDFGSKYPITFA